MLERGGWRGHGGVNSGLSWDFRSDQVSRLNRRDLLPATVVLLGWALRDPSVLLLANQLMIYLVFANTYSTNVSIKPSDPSTSSPRGLVYCSIKWLCSTFPESFEGDEGAHLTLTPSKSHYEKLYEFQSPL